MKNKQISLFTQSSTSTNDLSELDLKIKLLHRIHKSKSNTTHPTNQWLYDTLYESVCLDHDALNDPDAEPSFHKWTHDNQDPPNNHDTPAIQPVDQEDEYIQTRSNLEWYTKLGSENAMRKTTWFDLFVKSDIDQNENHILGPSTITIEKKLKAIIQKDELTIADLEGAGLERLKQKYHNDVELKYHIDQLKATMWNSNKDNVPKPRSTEEKYTTSITKNYAARYYKQGIKDMISDRWSKETHRYIFESLNVVKKKWGYGFLSSFVVRRSNDEEYKFSYADLPRLSLSDHENLVDMVKKNKLGTGNKRLKGRDWTDMDVKKSNETVDKINKVLKRIEQLRRLEAYVGGRPKIVNLRTFDTWVEDTIINKDEVIPESETPELIEEFQNVDKRVPTIFDHERMKATLRDMMSNQFKDAADYSYRLEYLNKNNIEDMYYLCQNKKVNYRENKLYSLMTFIRTRDPYSIVDTTTTGLIYLNSKSEKRIMNLVEIAKFCDAALERVLKEVKLKIFETEFQKKAPLLDDLDLDIIKTKNDKKNDDDDDENDDHDDHTLELTATISPTPATSSQDHSKPTSSSTNILPGSIAQMSR
ncbi:hypothetical protein Tco_1134398 [Tanacetum coccineum]